MRYIWNLTSTNGPDLIEFTKEFVHANTTETEVNYTLGHLKQKCIESVIDVLTNPF